MSGTPAKTRSPGGLLGAAAMGVLAALAFAFALSHVNTPLMFALYLSPPLLFVAGLGGGIAGSAAAFVAGGVTLFFSNPAAPHVAAFYLVLYALPIGVLSGMALRYRMGADGKVYWYPEGWLLAALMIIPCLGLVAAVAVAESNGVEGGLWGATSRIMEAFVNQIPESKLPPPVTEGMDVRAALIEGEQGMVRFLPSIIGQSWAFLLIISALVAQSSLRQQGWSIRKDGFSLTRVKTPRWVLFAAILAGFIGFAAGEPYGYIGANVSVMLALPFLFQGLGVIHAALDGNRFRILLLALVYILLVFAYPAVLVAMLGVADQWLNIRQRTTA